MQEVCMAQSAIEWIRERVVYWREKLFLEHWTITVRDALCVERDPDCVASARVYSAYNNAILTFRGDASPDGEKDWEETIIHEMLHVAHGRIDAVIQDVIIPQLPTQSQDIAESFVTSLALTIRNQDNKEGACNDGSRSSSKDSDDGSGGVEQGSTTSARKRCIVVY